MRTLGVVGALVAVAAVVVFGGASVAWADPGEAVTAFDAVVDVDAAGDLQVTETIGYRFAGTAHHGVLRELHSSEVTAVQVETPTGAPAATSVTVHGGYTTIRVGDPARTVSGTQTYVCTTPSAGWSTPTSSAGTSSVTAGRCRCNGRPCGSPPLDPPTPGTARRPVAR